MRKRKSVLLFGVFVAIFGILNCGVVEYAVAAVDDGTSQSHTDGNDACLTCHSNNHIATQRIDELRIIIENTMRFDLTVSSLPLSAHIRSIFRPPMAS